MRWNGAEKDPKGPDLCDMDDLFVKLGTRRLHTAPLNKFRMDLSSLNTDLSKEPPITFRNLDVCIEAAFYRKYIKSERIFCKYSFVQTAT